MGIAAVGPWTRLLVLAEHGVAQAPVVEAGEEVRVAVLDGFRVLIQPRFEVSRAVMLDDSPCVLHGQSTHRSSTSTPLLKTRCGKVDQPGCFKREALTASIASWNCFRSRSVCVEHVLAYSCSRDYPCGLQL